MVIAYSANDAGTTRVTCTRRLNVTIVIASRRALLPRSPPTITLVGPHHLPISRPLTALSKITITCGLLRKLCRTLAPTPTFGLSCILSLITVNLVTSLMRLGNSYHCLTRQKLHRLRARVRSRPPCLHPKITRLLQLYGGANSHPASVTFNLNPQVGTIDHVRNSTDFYIRLLADRSHSCYHRLTCRTRLTGAHHGTLRQRVTSRIGHHLKRISLTAARYLILTSRR